MSRFDVAQSTTFPTSTEHTILKQSCHSHSVSLQSQTRVTTVHRTDVLCISLNPE